MNPTVSCSELGGKKCATISLTVIYFIVTHSTVTHTDLDISEWVFENNHQISDSKIFASLLCLWIHAPQDFIQKSKPRGQNNKQAWSVKEAAAAITIITRSWQTFLGSASALLVGYFRNTNNKCFPIGFPRYHQYFSVALLRRTLNSAHTTGTNARSPLCAWAQASRKKSRYRRRLGVFILD